MRSVAGEDPIISGMAGRYATALFELARDAGALDTVRTELDALVGLIRENADIARLVRSPVFSAQEQLRALDAVFERAGIGGLSAQFVRLVTANRRLFALPDMVRAYKALVARFRGEVSAQVTVADRLSDQHLSALTDALKEVTGKAVQVELKIDPSIIGGLIVKLGSRMVDSSLKTKLNSIKHAMKEVG